MSCGGLRTNSTHSDSDPDSLPAVAIGVLVDANVLYSRTLRDWLFLLRVHSSGRGLTMRTSTPLPLPPTQHCF